MCADPKLRGADESLVPADTQLKALKFLSRELKLSPKKPSRKKQAGIS